MCKEMIELAGSSEPSSPPWKPVSYVIDNGVALAKFYEVPGVSLDYNLVDKP